jgi:hypothetical protein
MQKQILGRLVLLALAIVAGAFTAYGQISSAAPISGAVTDPAGEVVAGARVVVKHEATGATFTTTTVGNGAFTIPALNPGTYTVTVTSAGF